MENSGNFQANLLGPSPTMLHSLKGSADCISAQSGGLARYHSAPSSTFSALLEPDFFSANDNAELVQFLAQSGLGELTGYSDVPLISSRTKQASGIKREETQQVYSNQNDSRVRNRGGRVAATFPDHMGQGRLTAILEHAGEEALVSHPSQQNTTGNSLQKPFMDSNIESNLIRHSSLPADFLSRLAMEDLCETPAASQQMGSHVQTISQQIGSHMQTISQPMGSHMQTASPRTSDNTGGKVYLVTTKMSPRGLPVRKACTDEVGPCKEEEYSILDNEFSQHGLVRQSSSPAGLLAQLSLDEFANGTDKIAMSSAQGLLHVAWDDAAMDSKFASFGHRKRGREADGRLLKTLPGTDHSIASFDQISCPQSNHYAVVGASSGDSMVTDSVLCKLRAKRGCATHPRSIAERQRRMKISEKMKKLQDLVPNLDKQAHTADMLDEVVEYVKLLQRQVEELSKHSHECNGMCQNKGDNSDKV